MRHFAAAEIDAALDFPSLIDALARAFRGGFHAPERHHHASNARAKPAATPLLMPAWTTSGAAAATFSARRSSTSFPAIGARPARGAGPLRPAVRRHRRAARHDRRNAAHALAHRRRLGAGGAPSRARRRQAPADRRRRRDSPPSSPAPTPASDRSRQSRYGTIARRARIGSPQRSRARASARTRSSGSRTACATPTSFPARPFRRRRWSPAPGSRPGQHLDLVGAFNHAHARGRRRGAEARAQSSSTRAPRSSEGGDVALGLQNGAIYARRRRRRPRRAGPRRAGRGGPQEITLFKSVGAAIEDLAAAMLVWKKAGGEKL